MVVRESSTTSLHSNVWGRGPKAPVWLAFSFLFALLASADLASKPATLDELRKWLFLATFKHRVREQAAT